MMLIIADKSPDKAVDWLVENTNKNFCFKQLLELCQLICSIGFCNIYKKVNQGKELQMWIFINREWVNTFGYILLEYCKNNLNLKHRTFVNIQTILQSLNSNLSNKPVETAIWRYSKEYSSEYATNSELPIEVVTELYKKYLLEFKGFGKKEV